MTWILTFISNWKWVLIACGAALFFCAGYHQRTLMYEAGELGEAKKDLVEQKRVADRYHDASEKYQKLNESLLSSNSKLMDDANALPETNCDKLPISDDKLRLLKKSRSNLATR